MQPVLAAASLTAVLVSAALYLRRRLVVVTVRGASMLPSLRDGDRVLVRRCGPARLRRDAIVVAAQPRAPVTVWTIKRVVALPGDAVPADVRVAAGATSVPAGAVVVKGDSAVSVDSRQLGFYSTADVMGVVLLRLGRAPVDAVLR
jgi:signal peptidase I